MEIDIDYEWYEEMWFICVLAACSVLLVPLPFLAICVVRRMEKKQLCRDIVSLLFSVKYYLAEISRLTNEDEKPFETELYVDNVTFAWLTQEQQKIFKNYARILFNKILQEKIDAIKAEFGTKSDTTLIEEALDKIDPDKISKEVEVEKLFFENTVREKIKQKHKNVVESKGKVTLDAQDAFDDFEY